METVRSIVVRASQLAALLVLFSFNLRVLAQGTFQNLNFEAANIPPGTQAGTDFPASSAMPGWQTFTYGLATDVVYDGASLGGAVISINDSKTTFINFSPIHGSFSAILFAGPDGGAADTASISQTGTIPTNAKSILMNIEFPYGFIPSAAFTVSLSGQQIAMTPLHNFPNYTLYGGDISSYAGQTETLSITQFPPAPPIVPPSALAVDDIAFSPNPIPEPQTWILLLCGAGLIGAVRYALSKSNP